MRTIKIALAYDGTRFVGWQRQAHGESIQGLLEDALAQIEGSPVTVHGAGRTDAGVHALGQVASAALTSFHDTATLRRALNARLPPEIRVTALEDAPPGFHARFGATSKTYRYLIRQTPVADPFDRAYTWHVPDALNLGAMQEAAALLVGTHDFRAFQSTGTEVATTVRTLSRSHITTDVPALNGASATGLLAYEVTGDGFLRHMVRAIVGTLVDIGRGRREAAVMAALLAGATRAEAGRTAPPHGLFLVSVEYD
jgi:tRNA pseudouridine38-40 synthase